MNKIKLFEIIVSIFILVVAVIKGSIEMAVFASTLMLLLMMDLL